MINICYGITSYIIIIIGLLSVLSVFPQRRWKSRVVYIIFYILIAGGIAWESQDSTRGFVTDLQMIFNPIITLLLLKIFYISLTDLIYTHSHNGSFHIKAHLIFLDF